ncbi:SLC13 family permease [Tamaricihabitans halophyticus]|nr:DASS family sodium-coupled anion symporter [Tamaricihabitans halophyticus]
MASEVSKASDPANTPDSARTDVTSALLSGGTYRSLGEQRLSPKEERFERARRTVGFVLAPLIVGIFLLLPTGLEPNQHKLAAILLGVVVLWVCEPVPIPAGGLIGIALIVLLGVAPADEVLAPFGTSTVFVFIGAFILAQAMLRHGLAKRFAFRILSLPGVGKSAARVVWAFGLITVLLSAFITNTTTVAMLLPTAVGILGVIAELVRRHQSTNAPFDPLRLRIGVALLLMLAYGSSVGGLLTPIGSAPNLIGRAIIEDTTGTRISFLDWFLMALPLCLALFVVLAVVLLLLNRPELKRLSGIEEYVAQEREKLGTLSRAERNTLIAFTVTVGLWIAPGFVALIAGSESAAYDAVSQHLDEGIVAVFGAALLFFLPTNWSRREFTLTWTDASKIDWGTILLFGSGIIFGSLLESTKLAERIGQGAANALGLGTGIAILIFSVALAVLVSETTSNTAAAAVVVPILIPVAAQAGVDPFVPALAATFAVSLGFMLPVSTPQNAIVYGSGAVPITKMVRSGFAFDLLGIILVVLIMPATIALVGLG